MELILNIAIIIFIIMELSNVIIMYFKPDFKYGNSMIVFNNWHQAKLKEDEQLFVKYLVNWVANCKLIFILLLLVIVCFGNVDLKVYATIAMILSIGIYFITLHPIIKKLDKNNLITPKGYSKTLAIMIACFMIMFTISLIIYFITK